MFNTKRRKKKTEELFETIMTVNLPKVRSDTQPQMQKAQRTSGRINAKTKHNKT